MSLTFHVGAKAPTHKSSQAFVEGFPTHETRAEMKITVEIPTALRRFTEGVQTIECSSATLPELLGEIETRFPAITKHLRDDSGQIRRFIHIYVNEDDIR